MVKPSDIQFIVCDIDNTLIPAGQNGLSNYTKRILQKALQQGKKLMINTGRHYTFLQPSLFEDLPMDLIGTINGACLTKRDGTVIEKHPMSEANMNAITDLCIQKNAGLGFKFEDRIVTYANHQTFVDGYVEKGSPLRDVIVDDTKNRTYHEQHGYPLGTFIIGNESLIEPFMDSIPSITFAWSFRHGFDVFLKDVTKATSVEAALKQYGYTWDQVIGFGDAGNDTPFIKKSGIGVCMANSKDDIKEVSDIIASDCAEDAVAKVLVELGIVEDSE